MSNLYYEHTGDPSFNAYYLLGGLYSSFDQMSRLSQRNWLYCGYGEFIEHAAGHIFYADKLDGCHSSIEGGQDDLYQHCVQAGVNNCHDHRYHLVDL